MGNEFVGDESLLASLPKFLVGGKWSVGADVEHRIQIVITLTYLEAIGQLHVLVKRILEISILEISSRIIRSEDQILARCFLQESYPAVASSVFCYCRVPLSTDMRCYFRFLERNSTELRTSMRFFPLSYYTPIKKLYILHPKL